ncbi:MAG TPA: LON peptidase substrate-binding domain-containing protein [Roseiflexaceae bacterium]|nr:LON peptidase substrate-binding domain-containing protein [Roseiflexaceae bacterium]
MTDQLPLFPLRTVLFPAAPLTLHIFEERYRLMIGRCLYESSPFGVALIRSGSEVSPDDPWVRRMRAVIGQTGEVPRGETVPYAVGTSARITDSVRLEDGRYYLVVVGARRFRIQSITQRQPYLVAAVAYLEDERPAAASAAAARLRALYARYWAALSAATGQEHEAPPLPDDPLELSYALAHRMQVDNPRKQRWLESDTLTRLREIAAGLRAELALLPAAGPAHGGGAPWTWN